MHALVTGASGFLGGRLVELLRAEGIPVCVLARAHSRVPERSGQTVVRAELNAGPGPKLIASLQPVTHVFHCAGCSTDWASPAAYEQGNVAAVVGMLRLAVERMPRLERFLHVSTTDVYGYPSVPEDEGMALRDVDLPYNSSKLRGERLVWEAARGGLPVTIVRPASIYGPGGKAFVTDVVAMLRQRLMLLVDGGGARGGFVYVDDVCRAMLRAASSAAAVGEVYNLSSTDGVTWAAYTKALAAGLGLPPPWLRLPFGAAMALATASEWPFRLLPGHPLLTRHAVYLLGRDQQYDAGKAREQLGWRPEVSLEEGIALSAASLRV